MTLIPGQPYPELPAWEDLAPILMNGWGVPGAAQSLQGYSDANSVTVFGRVQIGTSHIIGNLPDTLRSIRPLSVQALILGGPPCLVELQGTAATGGWQMVMSAYSLGMSNAQMIATYGGKYLSIGGTYPRRSPV